MTAEDLLMEIQDCDELLYTSQEANLMLEYRDAVKKMDVNEELQEMRDKLAAEFDKLSSLIKEYEDRIHLTANNVTEPTKNELAELRKLFTEIEDLDFATSEKYEELTGNEQA
ncbi:MAG: hypothetical protein MJZ28_08605 [Paludibacteraceae bacterium]|nr:hypothetical protein [Paludibacteraceae bacterium]